MVRMRFSIFWKGLLLIAVPVVLELTALAMLFGAQRDAIDAENWALHSRQVMQQAEKVRRLIILTRDRAYFPASVPSRDRKEDLVTESGKLVELVKEDPAQEARAKKLDETAQEMMEWTSQAKGRMDDQGEALVQGAREIAEDFLAQEKAVDEARLENLADIRHKQQRVLIIAAIMSVGVAALAVWMFGQNVARRLEVLSENTRRMADGETLLPRVKGRDEIAELDEVLHAAAWKMAESQAREDQHQRELEEKSAELARTNEGLRQQTQENEMFVYSVSHDLRSPLVNLQGFSKELDAAMADLRQVMKDPAMPPGLAKKMNVIVENDVTEALKYIRSAVSRSSAIIDALLRLSRAGRVEYRMQPLDMTSIVRRVADALWSTARERGATVIVNELPPAMGDPTAIEQVFGNLVGNALNYLDPSRPGRVEIVAVEEHGNNGTPPPAGDNGHSEPGIVTFAVKDNGRGIPAISLSKVFVAFQRFHVDVPKGEGIGLALVRRVIERHEGHVRVESVEGEGTTFYVSLPRVDEKAAKQGTMHGVPVQEVSNAQ
jgi:signal transduction histidine kinase